VSQCSVRKCCVITTEVGRANARANCDNREAPTRLVWRPVFFLLAASAYIDDAIMEYICTIDASEFVGFR
jgi:hypothetical protein